MIKNIKPGTKVIVLEIGNNDGYYKFKHRIVNRVGVAGSSIKQKPGTNKWYSGTIEFNPPILYRENNKLYFCMVKLQPWYNIDDKLDKLIEFLEDFIEVEYCGRDDISCWINLKPGAEWWKKAKEILRNDKGYNK
jgi:hypothetical protein